MYVLLPVCSEQIARKNAVDPHAVEIAVFYLPLAEVDVAKARSAQVHVREAGLGELHARERGAGQVDVLERRARDVGIHDVQALESVSNVHMRLQRVGTVGNSGAYPE